MEGNKVFNPQTGEYTYTDLNGNKKVCNVKDLTLEYDDDTLTLSPPDNYISSSIIIEADSVTFRAGEFELKLDNKRLMSELNHTSKIIINGMSFVKEN